MSERYATWIRIGGHVRAEDFETFWEAVKGDNLYDDEDSLASPDSLDPRLLPGPLALHHYERAWGHFDGLEQACFSLKLPFVRWSEDGTLLRFDGETVTQHLCVTDGDVVMSREKLKQLGSFEAAVRYMEEANADAPPFTCDQPDAHGDGDA